MADPRQLKFKRQFALNMYKDKHISLAKMSLSKDFIGCTRGDPYPLLSYEGEFTEEVKDGKYFFTAKCEGANAERLLCRHFPYATYSFSPRSLDGKFGISIKAPDRTCLITFFAKDKRICAMHEGSVIKTDVSLCDAIELMISCRKDKFDIYVRTKDACKYFGSFTEPLFSDMASKKVFSDTVACTYASGCVSVADVCSYIDNGISQADVRPIRYENGDILTEQGKIYLTMSIRLEEFCYQGVFSWMPGTCELEMCGVLFFDAGDGIYGNDVASSILYHREEKKWLIWVCSFSHGHILAHASVYADPRFGINAIPVTLMPKMSDSDPDTAFLGKEGDEDPDFIYDSERGVWRMAVCRIVNDNGKRAYRYFCFESDKPFSGYRYIDSSRDGAETGGSIVHIDGNYYLICGNRFDLRADYRIYALPDMEHPSKLLCDFDDGGFRGWGTVIPIKTTDGTKYYHLTFDRHNASNYNWSYGDLYCFLAE